MSHVPEPKEPTRRLPILLLVEDEPADRELMIIALGTQERRCDLVSVNNGVEAIRYLQGEDPYKGEPRPDLIILDLNLPRKDGREVLQEIKGNPALRSIPVVVLSTSHDEGEIERAYDLGANSYIVKPGNFSEFSTIMRRLQDYWFASVHLPPTPTKRRDH